MNRLSEARVVWAVDGVILNVAVRGLNDTMLIICVDTPETKGSRKLVTCFGAEATAETWHLVDLAGGKVLLEKDTTERDKYNGLLPYL